MNKKFKEDGSTKGQPVITVYLESECSKKWIYKSIRKNVKAQKKRAQKKHLLKRSLEKK